MALRSVDSECWGRAIELRNEEVVGAPVVCIGEGSTDMPRGGETATTNGMRHRQRRKTQAKAAGNSNSPKRRLSSWLGVKVRPESENTAQAQGFPQEPGRSRCVRREAVPPSRGTTRAKRDEQREVLAARSTEEAGIAARATLWREGAVGSRNCWRERWQGTRVPKLSQRNNDR